MYTSYNRWYLSINRYNSKPVAILTDTPPALSSILTHDSGIEIQTVSKTSRGVALAKKPYVFLALVIVVLNQNFVGNFFCNGISIHTLMERAPLAKTFTIWRSTYLYVR